MKKVLALVLALCLALSLAACGGSGSSSSMPAASGSGSEPAASTTPTAAGSVYYLNFKPEQDEAWQALAKAYCCFSKRMRKLFRKNEKSVLRFCNKSSKTKRAFTKVLMPCKRPF